MKYLLLSLIVFHISLASAQRVGKWIKQKDVSRIVSTLASNDMMGRPATIPSRIEPATQFIENEFKAIGLQPLPGLTGYRQEIVKTSIAAQSVQLIVDGNPISSDRVFLVSDLPSVDIQEGLRVVSVNAKDEPDPRKYFFQTISGMIRDSSSYIVFIGPEFEAAYKEFKGYMGNRFTNNRPSIKVFVIDVSSSEHYSVKATQQLVPIKMNNLVGMLKGKSKAEEIVVFSSHYDHIGILSPVNGDSIANGADDDVSGTSAVIELARYYKKKRHHERTLIFAAFTAEEIGGYGSRYFSTQLDPDKVVAMFNIEMIGKPSKWGIGNAFLTGFEKSDLGTILQKNLIGTSFQIHPDPYPEQNLFYRSDNATLARLGVPAHSISTDQIDSDKLYHAVGDEVSSLNIDNLTLTIRSIALSARSIVAGIDTPKRIKKLEMR